MYTTLCSPPPTETWPTTNGWAYSWSSTGSVNTAPNCCTLTLLVVNAVSLSFQPDRVLSLCCVSTATDWGIVARLSVRISLQVASNRRTSGRASVRFVMRTLLETKCIQRPFSGHEHILAAAHGIRLRGVLDRADLGMPERHRGPPPPQAKGNQAPGSVVGEQQTARGRDQPGATSTCSLEAILPREFSRLIIDRGDRGPKRHDDILLAASQPHEHARILIRQVIHRVDLTQHDIQQTRPGIVARRIPVRCAAVVGRYQRAGDRVVLGRVPHRLSPGVDGFGPVGGVGVFRGEEVLARGPVHHEDVAVARRLHRQLARLP